MCCFTGGAWKCPEICPRSKRLRCVQSPPPPVYPSCSFSMCDSRSFSSVQSQIEFRSGSWSDIPSKRSAAAAAASVDVMHVEWDKRHWEQRSSHRNDQRGSLFPILISLDLMRERKTTKRVFPGWLQKSTCEAKSRIFCLFFVTFRYQQRLPFCCHCGQRLFFQFRLILITSCEAHSGILPTPIAAVFPCTCWMIGFRSSFCCHWHIRISIDSHTILGPLRAVVAVSCGSLPVLLRMSSKQAFFDLRLLQRLLVVRGTST